MKEFSVFIPILHHSLSEPLPPIGILHSKTIFDVPLVNSSKGQLLGKEVSELLKLIKEADCNIAIRNQLRQIRKPLCLVF